MAHLSPSLAEAVDMFVMRKFEDSFHLCCGVIRTAKCEPEHERNQEVIEASAALGIQALAETNLWDQAISFITDVYGSVDMCPPRIIQVCILLHAHVREYISCHNLVQHWLENQQNRENKHCAQVIRVYASHILHPTGCGEALKELVESCPSLTQRDKEALMQLPQSGRYASAEKLDCCDNMVGYDSNYVPQFGTALPSDTAEHYGGSSDVREDDNAAEHEKYFGNSISNLMESIVQKVTDIVKVRLKPWHQRFVFVIMAVFAVLSLVHSQTGDPVSSLGRLVILWKMFLKRLFRYFI